MIYVKEATLGELDFNSITGVIPVDFTIGWPTVREVINPRALTDGVIDTTTYLGQRAVTLTIRYNQKVMPTQDLLDLVTPYMSPRVRPQIIWTVQNPTDVCPAYDVRPTDYRSLVVRGADAPLVVDGPRYLSMVLQWVAQDSFTSALDQVCGVARATGSEEFGRQYDLIFDRDYPSSPVYGVTNLTAAGNAPTDWTATITSEITDPQFAINSVLVTFTGLTLLSGQTIIIDTQERTMLRNGDPTDSVYGYTNFADWSWDDLRMVPGNNTLIFGGDGAVGDPAMTVCWYDKWFS